MYTMPRVIACGYDHEDVNSSDECNKDSFLAKIKPYITLIQVYPDLFRLDSNEVKEYIDSNNLEGILFNFNGPGIVEFKNKFSFLAVESEKNLTVEKIKDHFLTKVFILAWFNEIKDKLDTSELVKFQARNKFLLMAYDRENMKRLGRIVANEEKRKAEDVFNLYQNYLYEIFQGEIRTTNTVDVLMHIKGFFKDKLTQEEKRLFLDMLESYKNEKIPLKIPKNVLKSWAEKYNNDYLLNQSFFDPYPEVLKDGLNK